MAFLEYGWPINFSSAKLPKSTFKNHSSALKRPDIIDDYIKTEMQHAAIIGPFESNPFSSDCVVSPLQVVIKDSTSKPRIVHDLSFPERFSVNDGISNDLLYFHVVLPFGFRSAVLICQRTTKAVVFILTKDNAFVDVYIDDFFGAAIVEEPPFVYNRLLYLLRELGLEISPEKCFEPSTRMVCSGIIFDTELLISSVPEDKIVKLKEELSTWLSRLTFTKRQLQSLLGKLSYVTACVQPGRIFMNRLLNVLRSFTSRKQRLPVTMEMRNDILWWLQFLDLYNGASVIPELYWREDTLSFSTDACLTGCGGLAFGEYFHTKFPDFILSQDLPIPALELLAITIAIKIWAQKLQGLRLVVHCDNDASVQAINHKHSYNIFMQHCLRELWLYRSLYNISLHSKHIPGATNSNTLADHLSR